MKAQIKKLLKEYRDLNHTSTKQAEEYLNGYTTKFLALLNSSKTKTIAYSPITRTNAISGETPRRGV